MMSDRELIKLWKDRARGMSIEDLRRKYSLTEQQTVQYLRKAPKYYENKYNANHGLGLAGRSFRQV